jgi:alkanesulfonate monooxygenase SsuD/methylene tetrahydromethanopterin reductase-like flavin-dependent oxidoreductase (luciferase family)
MTTEGGHDMSSPQRQLHFNAFLMSSGHHEAAWRLPESNPFANTDLGHWRDLAQIAERGTFDSLFLADGPAVRANPEFRPAGALEPTILLTALAAATSHIGLIATASTTYNEPYNLARRFASLDHVSGGRAGWNIVTTADTASAQNFGLDDRPGHQERYARAAEFVDVSVSGTAGRTARNSATRRLASTPTWPGSTGWTTRAVTSGSAAR